MVVPVKFVVACAAADDIFVTATIPDDLPEDAEFTRLYYLCPETEEARPYGPTTTQIIHPGLLSNTVFPRWIPIRIRPSA